GANLELARDIAMFANHGGCLIYGVSEPKRGRFELAPVHLDGLRERVDQVARARCDPPLHVDVRLIFEDEISGIGYLVVRVPPSPDAPHMVNDRYYGRAATTRTTLSDSEVRQIMTTRAERLKPIMSLLDEDIARDPVPPDMRLSGAAAITDERALREQHGTKTRRAAWLYRVKCVDAGLAPTFIGGLKQCGEAAPSACRNTRVHKSLGQA